MKGPYLDNFLIVHVVTLIHLAPLRATVYRANIGIALAVFGL